MDKIDPTKKKKKKKKKLILVIYISLSNHGEKYYFNRLYYPMEEIDKSIR